MSTHSFLKELRADPRFPELLEDLKILTPSPPFYRVSNEEDNDKQVSDWIFNSGRIFQGNTILNFFIGETEDTQ